MGRWQSGHEKEPEREKEERETMVDSRKPALRICSRKISPCRVMWLLFCSFLTFAPFLLSLFVTAFKYAVFIRFLFFFFVEPFMKWLSPFLRILSIIKDKFRKTRWRGMKGHPFGLTGCSSLPVKSAVTDLSFRAEALHLFHNILEYPRAFCLCNCSNYIGDSCQAEESERRGNKQAEKEKWYQEMHDDARASDTTRNKIRRKRVGGKGENKERSKQSKSAREEGAGRERQNGNAMPDKKHGIHAYINIIFCFIFSFIGLCSSWFLFLFRLWLLFVLFLLFRFFFLFLECFGWCRFRSFLNWSVSQRPREKQRNREARKGKRWRTQSETSHLFSFFGRRLLEVCSCFSVFVSTSLASHFLVFFFFFRWFNSRSVTWRVWHDEFECESSKEKERNREFGSVSFQLRQLLQFKLQFFFRSSFIIHFLLLGPLLFLWLFLEFLSFWKMSEPAEDEHSNESPRSEQATQSQKMLPPIPRLYLSDFYDSKYSEGLVDSLTRHLFAARGFDIPSLQKIFLDALSQLSNIHAEVFSTFCLCFFRLLPFGLCVSVLSGDNIPRFLLCLFLISVLLTLIHWSKKRSRLCSNSNINWKK